MLPAFSSILKEIQTPLFQNATLQQEFLFICL